jgi:hypothetical protein
MNHECQQQEYFLVRRDGFRFAGFMPLIDSPPMGERSESREEGAKRAYLQRGLDDDDRSGCRQEWWRSESRQQRRRGGTSRAAGREELRHGDTDLVGGELDLDCDDG